MADEKLDGQLFLGDNLPPSPVGRNGTAERNVGWAGEGAAYEIDPKYTGKDAAGAIYERVLLVTKDPTTPPKTRTKCVKMCQAWPAKFCCGWKIEYRWFYVRAVLRVNVSESIDLKPIVEDCLKQGAIAAAIAAILTGGSAAAAAAAGAVKSCLIAKLGEKVIGVSIDLEHYWGDWS